MGTCAATMHHPALNSLRGYIAMDDWKAGHFGEKTRLSQLDEVWEKVRISHILYDALSFVMLFINGTHRWHVEFRFEAGENQRKLTHWIFHSWSVFQRAMNSARLFQVVGYSSIIWLVISARWKLKCCPTCTKIRRDSVLRTKKLLEGLSETR